MNAQPLRQSRALDSFAAMAKPDYGRGDADKLLRSRGVAAWRQAMGWTQVEAAERIGCSRRMVQYYEELPPSKVPLTVRLACIALALVPGMCPEK